MKKKNVKREELEADGWELVCSFGNGWIFKKENRRILWLPLKEEVILDYTK
jgi:hypothetical protein